MAPQTIKVIIVDDHAILRDGLRQILEETQDIIVVAAGETAAQAIKLVGRHVIDVLLLDISLPDRSGLEVLKLL